MARESTINDFGLLIAYILPGFTALWGASYLSPSLQAWIGTPPADPPTVGGVLYMTIASIGGGIFVSTIRWMTIDSIHHRTGIHPPQWDFSLLGENAAAFGIVVDHYYRYYQCAANMVVALLLVLLARRWSLGLVAEPLDWAEVGLLTMMAVFFIGSRDSLRRYYTRGGQLLHGQSRTGKKTGRRRIAPRPIVDAEASAG